MSVAERALVGRRESELLAFPSVRRMADLLAVRCRADSWIRTSIASLERFRVLTGNPDLEALIERALLDQTVAEQALADLEQALGRYTDMQIAALTLGPKIWFRLNGVAAPWLPPTVATTAPLLASEKAHTPDRLALLALIGSGLHLSELLRLRLADVGSLDSEAQIVPDLWAEPLAVRFVSLRGRPREHITFLSFQARAALHEHLQQRTALGQSLDASAPLIARPDGSPATPRSVAYARQRNQALIRACNQMNVSICRVTGDFFRKWGMPGSRFKPVEEPQAVLETVH